jgi:hypothetical protein
MMVHLPSTDTMKDLEKFLEMITDKESMKKTIAELIELKSSIEGERKKVEAAAAAFKKEKEEAWRSKEHSMTLKSLADEKTNKAEATQKEALKLMSDAEAKSQEAKVKFELADKMVNDARLYAAKLKQEADDKARAQNAIMESMRAEYDSKIEKLKQII